MCRGGREAGWAVRCAYARAEGGQGSVLSLRHTVAVCQREIQRGAGGREEHFLVVAGGRLSEGGWPSAQCGASQRIGEAPGVGQVYRSFPSINPTTTRGQAQTISQGCPFCPPYCQTACKTNTNLELRPRVPTYVCVFRSSSVHSPYP